MNSSDGKDLKEALISTITEEKLCLEQFKNQLNFCKEQIVTINQIKTSGRFIENLEFKKKAFEEHQTILNVAARCQQCSLETKEKQLELYFENDDHQRARLAAELSVLIYEHCDDFLQMTAKQFQDMADRLLTEPDMAQFKEARKRLSKYFNQEKPLLTKLRNNVGAHRDHDFLKQMNILESINWADTIEILHRFEKVTLELGESLKPLMASGLLQIENAFSGSRSK